MATVTASCNRQTICYTIQAPLADLRAFFHMKDGIEAVVRESGKFADNRSSMAVLEAFRFAKSFPNPWDLTLKEMCVVRPQKEVESSPIIKMYLVLTDSELDEIEHMAMFISKLISKKLDCGQDLTFLVFYMVFSYATKSLTRFSKRLDVATVFGPSGVCLFCGSPNQLTYLEYGMCFKCKLFFRDLMFRRTLLSLRCPKNNNCIDGKEADLSCRKCRYDRFHAANLVEQYCYVEMPEFFGNHCAVCKKTSDEVRVVVGFNLCGDCIECFDKVMRSGADDIRCLNEPQRRCAVMDCQKCAANQMLRLGMIDTFAMKLQGNFEGSCWKAETCAVCTSKTMDAVESLTWMDIIVCGGCRSFLKMSLANDNHVLYCCPTGEVGHLCSLEGGLASRCSYCWFVRCEIEGLVERLQMCDGNAEKWASVTTGGIEDLSDDDGFSIIEMLE